MDTLEATARGFRFLPGGDFVLLFGQQLFPFRVRLLDFLYGHHPVLPGIINLDGYYRYTSRSEPYKFIIAGWGRVASARLPGERSYCCSIGWRSGTFHFREPVTKYLLLLVLALQTRGIHYTS